jgi:hypothetical protein
MFRVIHTTEIVFLCNKKLNFFILMRWKLFFKLLNCFAACLSFGINRDLDHSPPSVAEGELEWRYT